MKRLELFIHLCLFLCLIVFSSAHADITGPHRIQHIKGVCANCHIPHKAKGNKIWARELSKNFGGVRQLCNTCHDGTFSMSINANDPNAPGVDSGIITVFGSRYESHVMHGVADTTKDDWLGTYDENIFPLDPNDWDDISGHPDEWDRGGAGFYCGSCHNPHVQPEEKGDYLRTKNGDIGVRGNRSPFCKQCHDPVETEKSHLTSGNCQACHHPHKGYKKAESVMTEIELKIARSIFKAEVVIDAGFIAQPNVPDLSEDPNDRTFISSFFCYGCHQARHVLGQSDPNNNLWREAGAAPLYGDQKKINIADNTQRRNHHPMGTQARLEGGVFLRAPGAQAAKHLNRNGELTCISCHADLHGVIIDGKDYNQSKENNFLRWDFTNDNAEFCIKCHSDKIMGAKQIIYDGKHFWNTDSPISRVVFDPNAPDNNYEKRVSCKQCMFCHFIHDGEERNNEGTPGSIRADIDALMRIVPKNLAWGEKPTDPDLYDYEDMCFGCHGDPNIVIGTGSLGSLLQPAVYFTHRFASPPDPNSPTHSKIKSGGVYPLSDGPGKDTLNDYGTQTGHIFCGSCHNVHDGRISPYLNHEEEDINLALDNGFCEACHDENGDGSGEFVKMSHPVNEGPNPPATVSLWDPNYYQGGSGRPFGITGDAGGDQGTVICLTCHNVHACTTSYNGKVHGKDDNTHGILLIKDNKATPEGSDMCTDCHEVSDL